MVIGGSDLIVHVVDGPTARLCVMRIVQAHWPECVTNIEQPSHDRCEVFFHSTLAMLESWDKDDLAHRKGLLRASAPEAATTPRKRSTHRT